MPDEKAFRPDINRNAKSAMASAAMRLLTIIGFAALFLSSGVDKLLHLSGFYLAVQHYALVPSPAAATLTYLIPLLEIWVATGLLIPVVRRLAVLAAIGLLSSFTIALGINYLLGISAPCGCMLSITLSDATGPHIAFDVLLVFLCSTLWSDADTSPMAITKSEPLSI